MTVSMDANFGLVRKCNAGSSSLPPLITNDYFVDSSEVSDFVSTYGNDNVRDKVRYPVYTFIVVFVIYFNIMSMQKSVAG